MSENKHGCSWTDKKTSFGRHFLGGESGKNLDDLTGPKLSKNYIAFTSLPVKSSGEEKKNKTNAALTET